VDIVPVLFQGLPTPVCALGVLTGWQSVRPELGKMGGVRCPSVARSGTSEAPINRRGAVVRIAKFAAVCALAFLCCGAGSMRIQVSPKPSSTDALAYCSG